MDKDTRSNEASQDPNIPFRSQLGSLAVLAIIFYLNFVSRIILAPLLASCFFPAGFAAGIVIAGVLILGGSVVSGFLKKPE